MKEATRRKIVSWSITVSAAILLTIHFLIPGKSIDSISLFLFAFAVVPWLGGLFTKLELPGGLKFEFVPFAKAAEEARDAGLIEVIPADEPELDAVDINSSTNGHQLLYASLLDADPNLALAGLRIDLEHRLREMARIAGLESARRGLSQLLRDLRANEVLNSRETTALLDIIHSLNGAAHGEKIEVGQARQVMSVGQQIIRSLEERTTAA